MAVEELSNASVRPAALPYITLVYTKKILYISIVTYYLILINLVSKQFTLSFSSLIRQTFLNLVLSPKIISQLCLSKPNSHKNKLIYCIKLEK